MPKQPPPPPPPSPPQSSVPPPPPPPPKSPPPFLDFANSDVIQVENIRASGKHGVTAIEREACMPLELDIFLTVDLRLAESSDELAHTINYSSIKNRVVEIVETTSHKLLEHLAGTVLAALFLDSRIKAARLKISKPGRLDGATPSVVLVRPNPNAAKPKCDT